MNIIFDKDWIDEFISIPMQYRRNPLEISPTGDLFFADIRNVKKLAKSIENINVVKLTDEEQKILFDL